jgi:hypothetical protein
VTFGVLPNPVKILLLTMMIKSCMLPSISGQVHPMLECRFHTASWVIEGARRPINQNRSIVLQFCDITNFGNLLALEFDFLKNRVVSGKCANGSRDKEFSEASQKDSELSRRRYSRSLRHDPH